MSHDGAIEPRDQLQARVVERLRAAHGAPVTFEELRAMGIENPALLGYELAAAGLPIEQARESGGRALMLDQRAGRRGGERTDEQPAGPGAATRARAVAAGAAPRPPLSRPVPGYLQIRTHLVERLHALIRAGLRRIRHVPLRPSSAVRPQRAGVAAGVALIVVLAAVLALALSGHPARPARLSADHPRRTLARSPRASTRPYATQSTSQGAGPVQGVPSSPEPARGAPSVPVSPTTAASLEAAGHQLLSQGHYAQAIVELRGAVQASGGSVARCAEPTSEACLTFAYALYDLGSALRLAGDPHAAVPILSERLQIDNQRTVVEEQLDLARAGVA